MSVQQAVLGELVRQPDYPYAMAARLNASLPSIYQATERLVELGFVEPIEGENQGQRQRNYYQATNAGLESHRESVAKAVRSRREQLLDRLLHADLGEATSVLDEYESWLLSELRAERHFGKDTASQLVALELQFVNEACLRYVKAARQLLADAEL